MTTPPDELAFSDLALRHFEGALTAEETRALERLLANDPACARRFAALAMQRVQLSEIGRSGRALRAPRARNRWVTAGLVAAAVTVLLVMRKERPVPPPVAETSPPPHAPVAREPLRVHEGDVFTDSGGKVQAGAPLPPSGRLQVRGAGRAVVAVEGGRLILGADTTVLRAGREVTLQQGRLHADVRPGPILGTTDAQLHLELPARVRLEARPGETHIEVFEGTVRVGHAGQLTALEAGALGIFRPGRAPQVEEGEPPAPIAFTLQSDPRELALLRKLPPRLLSGLRGWDSNREGLVAANRQGFSCSGEQRHLVSRFLVGAATGNRKYLDEAWRVVDATMSFQAADGSFLDSAICDADWLGELTHGLAVLMESDWERPYRKRIKSLLPKLAKTATFLAQPGPLEELRRGGRYLSKRYFAQGAGFLFTGLLLGKHDWDAAGRELLDLGLHQQRDDGAFVVHDGTDSVYQAIILNHFAWTVLRFRDPGDVAAFRRGGQWLMSRVTQDGRLDMRGNTRTGPGCRVADCMGVDWQRVVWGLVYYALEHDPALLDVAQRLHEGQKTILE